MEFSPAESPVTGRRKLREDTGMARSFGKIAFTDDVKGVPS